MEFWGVEVKAGEPLKVKPGVDKLIHISQASLGEFKKDKGNDCVPLFLKFDDQKLVLGTLSSEKYPQISFDLLFEKEFELSHNWKNGSVYFCGYKTDVMEPTDESSDFDSDSDSEEELDLPLNNTVNGKPEPAKLATTKAIAAKPESSAKPKVKLVEPTKDNKSDLSEDEDTSGFDTDSSSGDESDDETMLEAQGESDDDSTDDEEEETPKKAEPGKKRPTESATKTPVPAKKTKLATPQKTDGKKGGGHTATPHPSKKAVKTPNSGDKSKAKTPKSGGQVSCNTCSKTFNSDGALQSHSKAKHSAGK